MLMIMSDYELYSIRQEIQTLNAEVAALKQLVKDLEDERRKIWSALNSIVTLRWRAMKMVTGVQNARNTIPQT